jgi:uncharacterized protein (DUF697 family)/predicted GTPase
MSATQTKSGTKRANGGVLDIEEVIRAFEDAYAKEQEQLGRFNLAIFGKTGVGKSTLVNTVFSESVAKTGNGRPVTEGVDYYAHPSGCFGVYDSEGIETGEKGDAILERFRGLIADKRSQDISEHIHVIWYCVRWSDRRFEDSQAEFVSALAAEDIPVLFVLTQVPRDAAGQLHPDAVELAEDIMGRRLPLAPENRVFHTMALADTFSGHTTHGVQGLLDATFRVAPDAVVKALIAAQKIDVERKAREARKVVAPVAASAAAAGAVPIPFADAGVLIPIQVGMMARIAAIFGLGVQKGTLATLAGAALAGGGVAQAGKYLVTNMIKALPGGNVVGGVIRAGVASTLTYAVGEAWIVVCTHLYKLGPDAAKNVPNQEIRRLFMNEFKKRASRKRDERAVVAT